jgi:hypothetical protein
VSYGLWLIVSFRHCERSEAIQGCRAQPEEIARPKEGADVAERALDRFASLAMTALANALLGNRITLGLKGLGKLDRLAWRLR